MFPTQLLTRAATVLDHAAAANVRITAAETCTAGLLSACLTSVPGASQVFERSFVLYHESAKSSGLNVDAAIAAKHGAVSAEVTRALAGGALAHSTAGISAAITGYAGPGGGNDKDPVGTVYVAVARIDERVTVERHVFDGDRDAVRLAAVAAALELLATRLET